MKIHKRKIRKGTSSYDNLVVWVDYCGNCGLKFTDKSSCKVIGCNDLYYNPEPHMCKVECNNCNAIFYRMVYPSQVRNKRLLAVKC